MEFVSKTSWEEIQSHTMPTPTRKGCLGGCLVLLVGIFLIYIVGAAIALTKIEANYRKWLANRTTNYLVTVRYGTYSGFYNSGRESVSGSQIVRSDARFNEPAIDRVFERARRCVLYLSAVIFPCKVNYDPHYGYPSRFSESDLDAGEVIELTDFTPNPQ